MIKDFTDWHGVKTEIQQRNPPTFREREIWWCNLGLNVGDETDGKHEHFMRPVLVLRKFNSRNFLAIPISTKHKDNPYYFRFHFHGGVRSAMLSQVRMMDARRLVRRMGSIRPEPFAALQDAFCGMVKNTQPRF